MKTPTVLLALVCCVPACPRDVLDLGSTRVTWTWDSQDELGSSGDLVTLRRIAETSDGGVVAVGRLSEGSSEEGAIVRRFDSDGDVVWTTSFVEEGQDIAVGPSGTIVVVGRHAEQGFVMALSPEGAPLWQVPIVGSSIVWRVETLSDGRIIAIGFGAGLDGTESFVAALDPAGQTLWSYDPDELIGPGSGVSALAVSSTDVIALGGSGAGSTTWLARLSGSAEVLWTQSTPALAGSGSDWIQALAIDAQQSIFVAGSRAFAFSDGGNGGFAGSWRWFRRFDASGTLLWERGPTPNVVVDEPPASPAEVVLGDDDTCYWTGRAPDGLAVVAMDADGDELWRDAASLPGDACPDSAGLDVVIAADGALVAAGDLDYRCVSSDDQGSRGWLRSYATL